MDLVLAIIAIITVIIACTYISWYSHISMTKCANNLCGWASFKSFKKNFDATEWTTVDKIDDCLYKYVGRDSVSRITMQSFRFNNIGMLMRTPISLMRAKRYAKKYIKFEGLKDTSYKWD